VLYVAPPAIFIQPVFKGTLSTMNIHEYQAKELLRRFGVAVPDGKVAYTVDEAVQAATLRRNQQNC